MRSPAFEHQAFKHPSISTKHAKTLFSNQLKEQTKNTLPKFPLIQNFFQRPQRRFREFRGSGRRFPRDPLRRHRGLRDRLPRATAPSLRRGLGVRRARSMAAAAWPTPLVTRQVRKKGPKKGRGRTVNRLGFNIGPNKSSPHHTEGRS